MKSSKLPYFSREVNIPKWLAIAVLIVSVAGFLDAAYLTVEHYSGTIPPCSVVEGCETVLTSTWATVAGIPVALAGALYYLLIFVLSVIYLDTRSRSIGSWALKLTPLGFIASLWFLYLQAFVIEAFCLYCLGSAITSTLLFALGMSGLFRKQV